MTESKFQTAVGMCVIALTRHIMEKEKIDKEEAYKELIRMELFELLGDIETRLYLESNDYLCRACDMELDQSIDAMYDFIDIKR